MNAETILEFVGDIGSEAERLTRITERLLELTRLNNNSEVSSVPIDFKKIISNALKLLTPLADEKSVALSSTLSDGCLILADADDVYQAVFNLIENAIKYNVENGSVTLLLFPKDGKAQFITDDTGVGIPENELPQIFERFYRVDKARASVAGGSGLGLSIVKDVAEKHSGNVTVERGAISGTRFTLSFPLIDMPIVIKEDE
jgi:signal transduction histidine kinase